MKKFVQSTIVAAFVLSVPVCAFARPSLVNRCQTASSSYSEVTVCAQQDAATGQIYDYSVIYRGGLLNESQQVLLGGIKSNGSYRFNIYEGSSDWSNRPLTLLQDGSGIMGFSGGGNHVEIYFQIPGGKYDSRLGQNYVFDF